MLHHLASAIVQVANLINYNVHPKEDDNKARVLLSANHKNIILFHRMVLDFFFFLQYLHFQSKPLMNATVHSLMKDIHFIDCCQAHLPVQYSSKIFIRQK